MALLDPPVRRRRFAFMLTPLVDVMFLLLIFFMFTTQTAPYSLLAITAPAAAPGAAAAPPTPAPAQGAPPPSVLISIEHGFVSYDGRRIALAELPSAIAASKAAGLTHAVVLTTGTATVQDVISVVEAFDASAFGDVQLIMQGSGLT
jgi:biopolymer transport protein ExbD